MMKEDCMRILGMTMTMMFLSLGVAPAAQVNLNDGRTVQGDIIKQDNKSIQINVDGVTMTYYADEVKDIDGTPFAAAQSTARLRPAGGCPYLLFNQKLACNSETSADQGTGNIG